MDKEIKSGRQVPRAKALVACVLCLLLGAAVATAGLYATMGREGLAVLQAQRLIEEKFVGD